MNINSIPTVLCLLYLAKEKILTNFNHKKVIYNIHSNIPKLLFWNQISNLHWIALCIAWEKVVKALYSDTPIPDFIKVDSILKYYIVVKTFATEASISITLLT